ncbi:MAG: NAD(P)/FAD-dependent oxidoreductase [Gallionellaceae bacterium]|jgi:predicted Rossmann fold flavoprotein|nr:NAD(P)/FAD-dependent oxidoreductase [Gallionellaceae bacterium]
MPLSASYDVIILGAGAAGMMCAATAAQRGRSVLLLDHASKLAEKIRISGGGRCNFTNLDAAPENYFSENPHFCRSALARYTPRHFIDLLERHDIGWHEKKLGQLFCDEGSEAVIGVLKRECDAAGVRWRMSCEVQKIERADNADFLLQTSQGAFRAQSLVVATGGLSIPKIGATPLGYRIAEQFGIPITKLKPGLVPLSFAPMEWAPYAALSGVSLDANVRCGDHAFRENLLLTHRGLSGPAILQISSCWTHGEPLRIDLLPDGDFTLDVQRDGDKLLANVLAQRLPKKFADIWCAQFFGNKPLKQYDEKQRAEILARLRDWRITPSGTLGYAKAEVTCGGVDTRALSSKTMACRDVPGLYFIGEVVDVTGWLGGYNFQWAWASGHAAGASA